MSHQAIDQLLQITTPTYSGPEAARTGSADRDLFRAHLNRAAEVAEPKPAVEKRTDEAESFQEDELLGLHSGQQETSTAEQEQTAAAAESSEPTAETPEESPSEQESGDEVTLSAAAVAQPAEAVTTAEHVASTDEVVEAALADGQQQSGEHPTPQSAEATNDSATSTTGTESVELEAALLGEGGVGETASETSESSVEAETEVSATKTTVRTETGQLAGAAAVEGEAKKSQSSATVTSTNSQQTLAKQPLAGDTTETLRGTESEEGSTKTASGRFDVPTTSTTATTTTSGEFAVANEAELALANLNNASEPTTNAHNASNPSSADTVAAAGRTLGNLLAGKTAASATTTNTETPATETPTVDRARFVQRVGGAIRSAQNRDGQIQLRLSPPELGTLRINIVLNEGVLTAHLETETTAARAVLLDNLPALRERLAEQEIRIEKFDVNVGQEGQQQTDNPETDDRQDNRSRSQTNQPSSQKNPSLDTDESNSTQPVTASGLDVRI